MFRRKELLFIVLVQAAITLILSSATPNSGIVHPGMDQAAGPEAFFEYTSTLRGF